MLCELFRNSFWWNRFSSTSYYHYHSMRVFLPAQDIDSMEKSDDFKPSKDYYEVQSKLFSTGDEFGNILSISLLQTRSNFMSRGQSIQGIKQTQSHNIPILWSVRGLCQTLTFLSDYLMIHMIPKFPKRCTMLRLGHMGPKGSKLRFCPFSC